MTKTYKLIAHAIAYGYMLAIYGERLLNPWIEAKKFIEDALSLGYITLENKRKVLK